MQLEIETQTLRKLINTRSNPNTKLLLRRQSFQSSISKGERIDKIELVLDPNNKITILTVMVEGKVVWGGMSIRTYCILLTRYPIILLIDIHR